MQRIATHTANPYEWQGYASQLLNEYGYMRRRSIFTSSKDAPGEGGVGGGSGGGEDGDDDGGDGGGDGVGIEAGIGRWYKSHEMV